MVGTASGNDTVQLVASHSEEDLQHNGVDESIEEAITADAPPDQQKEGATGAATAEDQQKERTPIVWVGRSKEPSATTSSAAAEAPATANDSTAERPLLRLKPNAGFLLNLVVDAERGNKRKCAEEATQVSLNVLGQVRHSFQWCMFSCADDMSTACKCQQAGDFKMLALSWGIRLSVQGHDEGGTTPNAGHSDNDSQLRVVASILPPYISGC